MRLKKAISSALTVMMMTSGALMTNSVFAQDSTATATETSTQTTADTSAQTVTTDGWQADGTYVKNGVKQYGAITIDGKNYYLDDTTGVKKTDTWVGLSYYDGNGVRFESGDHQAGLEKIHYYFVNGEKQTNVWHKKSYYDAEGKRVESGVYTIDGATYYFINGVKQVNVTIGNYTYGSDGKRVANAYATINGKKIYLNANGQKATGLYKVDGKYIYFTKGVAYSKTGWKKIGSKVYYFKKGAAVTGLNKINKKTYYFSSSAVLQKGFKTVNKKKYYFTKTGKLGVIGAAKTGLFKVGSSYYYANANGVLTVSKTVKINNKYYKFNKNGKAVSIKKVSYTSTMDAKAQSYSSPTKYLILVSRSQHRVSIYKGSKNNWKRVKSFLCGDGKASTPTITGVFHTGTTAGRYAKARYFDSGSSRCWYATRITGGYLFHSVLYTQSSSPTTVKDGRVGMGVSHGCIRLKLQNAKWIYDNIPRTTTVVIY